MTTRALGGIGWAAACLAAWALAEPTAHAAVTCDGRVCPEGFTCETTTSSCASDEPDCEVFTETYCQSPSCAEDSDCPAGRRCHVETLPCDPPPSGSGGGAATPPDCTPTTESWCHLSYDVECENDAQCGAGFTCKPIEACDCSNPEAPVPEGCSCELASIKGCYTPIVACTAATATADCPSGWSCIENDEGLCNTVGDLHTGCAPGEPPSVCVPPGFGATTTVADTDGGDPPEATDDGAAVVSDGGGCAIGGPASSSASALVLAVVAGLGLGRRRRAT